MFNNNHSNHINHSSIINDIRGTNKVTCETNEIGKNVLEKLSQQGAQLKKNDEKLEYNNYFLLRSARVLRSMTWFGWIINFFTIKPAEPEIVLDNDKSIITKKNEYKIKNLKISSMSNKSSNIDINEDREISEIENEIKNLHNISVKIGECLDNHIKDLSQMSTKTEDIIIKTKETISKANSLC